MGIIGGMWGGIIGGVEAYTPRSRDRERRVYALPMPIPMYEQVQAAAERARMSVAEWLRLVIAEKLEDA